MQKISVKDLAVSLSDYATVIETATLADAIAALERKKDQFDPRRPRHRAVLVLDPQGTLVGKIGFHQILQSLEPKYSEAGVLDHMGGNFTPDFIKSQLEKYNLWQQPLDDICRKAARSRVRDFMHIPHETEFIDENATLDQAVHQLITVKQQSLLITRSGTVVGILRLSDVVEKVTGLINSCDSSSA